MCGLAVPYAVAMQDDGVYAGTGGLSIEQFVRQYIESGDALREWVQLWAVAQETLRTWAEGYGQPMPDAAGP